MCMMLLCYWMEETKENMRMRLILLLKDLKKVEAIQKNLERAKQIEQWEGVAMQSVLV